MLNLLRKSYSGLSRDTWILALVTLVNRSGMMVLPFMTIYLTSALNFTVVVGRAKNSSEYGRVNARIILFNYRY